MTTPERLRRRQLIEGAVLVVIGIAMLFQSWYFHHEDTKQRECLEGNVSELVGSLEARAELVDRETKVTKDLWLIYAEAAGLIKDDPTADLRPKDEARLQTKLVASLLDYQQEIRTIERERRQNPVPPYPAGRCE